jgi:hypothetical protein
MSLHFGRMSQSRIHEPAFAESLRRTMSAIVPLVAHKTLYLGNPHDAAYYDPLLSSLRSAGPMLPQTAIRQSVEDSIDPSLTGNVFLTCRALLGLPLRRPPPACPQRRLHSNFPSSMTSSNFYDLIVIGGGSSGVASARFYLDVHPEAKVTILERDNSVGGVWSSG